MDPIQEYLKELRDIRSTGAGVPETSYYPALSNLLNEVGKTLRPKVRCVMQLANRGAGNPDGGLFTPDQLQDASDAEPLLGQVPSRGVIEVKSVSDDTWVTAGSIQVAKYWKRYGLVLVTNYRDFMVVGRDDEGKPKKFESFCLAESEKEFWDIVSHPGRARSGLASRFIEFLKRVMLHSAPLSKPEDVAWFLASYARDARSRIEDVDVSTLDAFRAALEESLGMKFEGPDGENLFRSSFIQTLFYGVFSAWVLWAHEPDQTDKSANFDWKRAGWWLHVPMIRVLYEEVSGPLKLRSLDLVEPLDWTAEVLNRVDRDTFFATFDQGEAVQYFYEPFLEQFDHNLRKRYGVWYTPPEIVKYMVARVDTVLREELGIADGLADDRVLVLDPCCGTGAYLVEVLRKIAETLQSKGGDALASQDIKHAATERVFGFEIMPAPFVVAHLQVGLLLQRLGAPLSHDAAERAAVYLTNALTDWEPPKDPKDRVVTARMSELDEERAVSARIKREKPILVVLGNPPYNAFAGKATTAEEQTLIEPYKTGLNKKEADGGWGIRKFNLDELYVRFFRLAERRIVELSKEGVICFISSFSYLREPSFVVMRDRFLHEFSSIWIDNMNGDSRETGKLTPNGEPDPSAFSTESHPVGIRVGTSIGLLVRTKSRVPMARIHYREFWGVTKREDLVNSLKKRAFAKTYADVSPTKENRYSLQPAKVSATYLGWPKISELSALPPFNGPIERRGNSLILFEAERARFENLRQYLDPSVTDVEMGRLEPAFMKSSGEFNAAKARSALKGMVKYDPACIVPYPFKPFDIRLSYLDARIQPLFSRPSPQLLSQSFDGNAFFITRDTADKTPEGPPFYLSPIVCDYDFISGHARHFPILVRTAEKVETGIQIDMSLKTGLQKKAPLQMNLSAPVREYLNAVSSALGERDRSWAVWHHVLSVGYSPAYLRENADGVRENWPRVPLPTSEKQLLHSASLGRQIVGLLDVSSPVKGLTTGVIRTELSVVGNIDRVGAGRLNPSKGELQITAGWGHRGKDGIVMPGKGRLIERDYSKEEFEALRGGARALGLSFDQALAQWGVTTCDVYLNDVAYWKNVPKNVWEYVIGGYQVVKKWLSYRERSILDRGLTKDEAREVTNMCRRIAAILLLQPALDENYHAIKESCFDWSSVKAE